MKTLRILWPFLIVFAAILVSWGAYITRPVRRLDIVVVDKTVPFEDRIEHRSFFWLLNHLRIRRPDGSAYDSARDYVGAFPGPEPGDPPARTTELAAARAEQADLVYLADTYGVYREDLESGPAMKAALERSPKIYGGLEREEAEAAARAVKAGSTLIAEFNTLGSPTEVEARSSLEATLGVRWTRWIGRFFSKLDDHGEVPQWMRRDYEREWKTPWEFRGAGFVLLQDDAHCEVLRTGIEAERIGLTLEREGSPDTILAGAREGTSYPYWFDIVETAPGTERLASFRWHLTAAGSARLAARRLPARFAAITRRRSRGEGPAYYFAGDFADNPMSDAPVPLAGFLTARRWFEAVKLYPSESSFYWCFYAPMMTALLESLPAHGG